MTQPFSKKFPPALQNTPLVSDDKRVSREWLDQFTKFSLAQAVKLTNTQRLTTSAGSFSDGSIILESDTSLFYVAFGGAWMYLSGTQLVASANLPGLTNNDVGLRVYVTDFAHGLFWDGAQWNWSPEDAGSGYIVPFVSAPNPTIGWQVCDGSSNVARLNGDGTVTFENVPNTAGSYFRQ